MAKTEKYSQNFDVPATTLLDFLTDPGVREAESVEIGGAVEATAVKREPSAGMVEVEVKSKTHPRGLDGKRDKSRLENALYVERWDLNQMSSSWSYRMEETFGDRIFVSGRRKIIPTGPQSCVLEEEVTIDVKIPMIGGVIAGKVIASITRGRAKLIEWMRDGLKTR